MKKNKEKFPKPKNVTLDLQIYKIKQSFPGFKFYRDESGTYWVGQLMPTSNSCIYTVRIVYKYKKPPQVFVIQPELLKLSPHIYADGSLCLYYPFDKDYNNNLSIISETIIPWTAEWLFFYEKWLDSGIWWGPEAPHGEQKIERVDRMEEFS
ncbi:hypothetical protein [Clostridium saccharobutylicum]|uniref:Type II CBASS E2 protein domain-containing protein n=1 Tax=Clostridium saccharobutylicum TaxID=169679 RepID=A0A1S8MNF8_CLOSA|nr:hypothetical protein [Clostridium saccharobutylicum]OOM05691.1 hypothetical protein CLOSAC_45610 [Clostridium saccharobutylicum]